MKSVLLLTGTLLLIGCGSPSARLRSESAANRAKILSLVAVGDLLSEAETRLKNAGFSLVYSQPVDPTKRGEYIQQLVVIHPDMIKPTTADTFRYTVGLEPDRTRPSGYLVIDASTDGKIIRLR